MGKSKIKMQLSLWAEFDLTLFPKNEAEVGNDIARALSSLYWKLHGPLLEFTG